MDFTFAFLRLFAFGLYLTAPILLTLLLVIVLLGQRVGRIEKWSRADSLYWSFITASTVGYGDFRPTGKASKILAVIIAFTGLIFTGIIVAIALQSANEAFKSFHDMEAFESAIKTLKH